MGKLLEVVGWYVLVSVLGLVGLAKLQVLLPRHFADIYSVEALLVKSDILGFDDRWAYEWLAELLGHANIDLLA